jgi:hypothetical protein
VIRYVISFSEAIPMAYKQEMLQMFKDAVEDRRPRDFILDRGATITDMRRPGRPALVRRARALHR